MLNLIDPFEFRDSPKVVNTSNTRLFATKKKRSNTKNLRKNCNIRNTLCVFRATSSRSKIKVSLNTVLERHTSYVRIKYPFLIESQVRGRVLQTLGLPNCMGELVKKRGGKSAGSHKSGPAWLVPTVLLQPLALFNFSKLLRNFVSKLVPEHVIQSYTTMQQDDTESDAESSVAGDEPRSGSPQLFDTPRRRSSRVAVKQTRPLRQPPKLTLPPPSPILSVEREDMSAPLSPASLLSVERENAPPSPTALSSVVPEGTGAPPSPSPIPSMEREDTRAPLPFSSVEQEDMRQQQSSTPFKAPRSVSRVSLGESQPESSLFSSDTEELPLLGRELVNGESVLWGCNTSDFMDSTADDDTPAKDAEAGGDRMKVLMVASQNTSDSHKPKNKTLVVEELKSKTGQEKVHKVSITQTRDATRHGVTVTMQETINIERVRIRTATVEQSTDVFDWQDSQEATVEPLRAKNTKKKATTKSGGQIKPLKFVNTLSIKPPAKKLTAKKPSKSNTKKTASKPTAKKIVAGKKTAEKTTLEEPEVATVPPESPPKGESPVQQAPEGEVSAPESPASISPVDAVVDGHLASEEEKSKSPRSSAVVVRQLDWDGESALLSAPRSPVRSLTLDDNMTAGVPQNIFESEEESEEEETPAIDLPSAASTPSRMNDFPLGCSFSPLPPFQLAEVREFERHSQEEQPSLADWETQESQVQVKEPAKRTRTSSTHVVPDLLQMEPQDDESQEHIPVQVKRKKKKVSEGMILSQQMEPPEDEPSEHIPVQVKRKKKVSEGMILSRDLLTGPIQSPVTQAGGPQSPGEEEQAPADGDQSPEQQQQQQQQQDSIKRKRKRRKPSEGIPMVPARLSPSVNYTLEGLNLEKALSSETSEGAGGRQPLGPPGPQVSVRRKVRRSSDGLPGPRPLVDSSLTPLTSLNSSISSIRREKQAVTSPILGRKRARRGTPRLQLRQPSSSEEDEPRARPKRKVKPRQAAKTLGPRRTTRSPADEQGYSDTSNNESIFSQLLVGQETQCSRKRRDSGSKVPKKLRPPISSSSDEEPDEDTKKRPKSTKELPGMDSASKVACYLQDLPAGESQESSVQQDQEEDCCSVASMLVDLFESPMPSDTQE